MQEIQTYNYIGRTLTFEPPINLPDGVGLTLGALAAYGSRPVETNDATREVLRTQYELQFDTCTARYALHVLAEAVELGGHTVTITDAATGSGA